MNKTPHTENSKITNKQIAQYYEFLTSTIAIAGPVNAQIVPSVGFSQQLYLKSDW